MLTFASHFFGVFFSSAISLSRERRCLDVRRRSLVTAVEEALQTCSLRSLAESSRSRSAPVPPPPPPPQQATPRTGTTLDEDRTGEPPAASEGGDTLTHAECAASAARAVRLVRNLEDAVTAAEREYAKRARDLVRLRAAASLRDRQRDGTAAATLETPGVGETLEACEGQGNGGVGSGSRAEESVRGRGGDMVVVCDGCTVLFESNERLLQEARSRGLLS